MSNDDLQKAIDDITSGDAAAAVADESSATPGTASVTLPDDLAGNASTTDLNFAETPDATAGASADIFTAPPAPDTSSAMPAGVEEPATNPATEAAPAVDESALGADPLAGFDPSSVTLNTAEPAVPVTAEPVVASESPAVELASVSEIPTTDSLDAKPAETPVVESANTAETGSPEIEPIPSAVNGDVISEAKKELYPLLDKVPSMSSEDKCDVCLEVGGDALPKALQYAKEIPDETVKAEKLLKIIEGAK